MDQECTICRKHLLRCKCPTRERVQVMLAKNRAAMREQLRKIFKRDKDLVDSETEEEDQDQIL